MNNIQHTFLVSSDIERWFEKYPTTVNKIEQYYISTYGDNVCYYMKSSPATYVEVRISPTNQTKVSMISSTMYESQSKYRIGRVIVKQSHTITIDEKRYVIEKYLEELKDLYIFIGVFENDKAVRDSKIISMLDPFIFKNIDYDAKYSSKTLALGAKPLEYNIQKLFDKIDAFVAPNLFFWRVPKNVYTYDGVRLILYRNIRLIHHYKVSFQAKQFASTLHRLRILLHRTKTMLEIFPDLLTTKAQHLCMELFGRYYEETKTLRYLYFLNELCVTREDIKLALYSALKTRVIEEEQRTIEMLSSKSFAQMMHILTQEIQSYENHKYISLEEEIKDVTRKRFKNFEILLADTAKGYDDETLDNVYLSIDTLQTFIEDFFHVLGEKKAQRILDELNSLLKPLREYKNCKERALLLSNIQEGSDTQTLDIETLLCEHEDMLKENIAYALKLLRSSKFYI
ncbi:MAG: CHAD domain-containing protein [uncultured Sulfurovum sp.]|uniref:CHAD domain-containing protein n=1 Tax=uncultured Sulfurovum sp. TaxID=269237 RepID=A0A6S6SW43_9BACT|nr:MAG: CHAD domain-containing protein [uncultured Sulfurovum sp.]